MKGELCAACDEARIVQVLLNLIVNAAQALPEGQKQAHAIVVAAWLRDSNVVLEVIDDGPGIPAEVLDRVREPFFTTKPVGEGTGLGLAISEGIVRSYGGSLDIESEPGRTVVRVILPARSSARSVAPPPAATPLEEETSETRLRILICDDDELVARAMRRHLTDHDVDIAAGGEEALTLLDRRHDYDIVFCDIMMPNVSGMDVFDAIESRYPELVKRLVFMSGGTFTESARVFRERLGDIPFAQKPIGSGALTALLRRYRRS